MSSLIPVTDGEGVVFMLQPSEGRIHLSRDSAVQGFLKVWTRDTLIPDLAEQLTCTEAEALAELLAAFDYHDDADGLREYHIPSDDSGALDHNTLEQRVEEHRARPDDDPEPGDRCKDCGKPVTWIGPSQYDWEHVE